MANIACLLAQAPNGLWEKIIFAFNSSFGNYALAIIMITLIIKILMLPTDFLNRRSTAKMTEVQSKLQPKIQNIQRKYPDKNVQNQKINELYQKEGFNPMGSCLTPLIVMILSTTIFISLFTSLNNMAAYKIVDQYEQLQKAYISDVANEDIESLDSTKINEYVIQISESGDVNLIAQANQNVKEKYKDVKESFLWIKNVWIADSPFQRAIPSFEKYASLAKLKFDNSEGSIKKEDAKKVYNAVMGDLEKSEGINGYFLLSVITAISAFLYQYLLTKKKQSKQKVGENPQQQSGKAMLFIFPIIMLIFTLSYNSVFSIYIIVGQLFGMATAPLINKLLTKKEPKKVTAPEIIDVEPQSQPEENVSNISVKKDSKNTNKSKQKSKTKGKAIKYPKKTNKGV